MKMKRLLAGIVALALVITGIPLPGLRGTQVQAAEGDVYIDVPIRMGATGSQELTGESNGKQGWAKYAVDGDTGTFWHTKWQGGSDVSFDENNNNSFYIALNGPSAVDKVTYLSRSAPNGTVLACDVYVTTDELAGMPAVEEITDQNTAKSVNDAAMGIFTADEVNWTKAGEATWEANDTDREVVFDASQTDVTGIKITVTNAVSDSDKGEKFISAAEFGVQAKKKEEPPEPVYKDVLIQMGAAESQELTGERTNNPDSNNGWAVAAVDGKADTFWHSAYRSDPKPSISTGAYSSYYIALKGAADVDKITYLPRQNDGKDVNGTVQACEIYVTTDALAGMPSKDEITDEESAVAKNNKAIEVFQAESVTWKKVAISTFDGDQKWANDDVLKEIIFGTTEKNVTGIKIKVTATGTAAGGAPNQHISGAEFGVKAIDPSGDPGPIEPDPTYVKADIQMGAAESQELTGERTNNPNSNNGWAVAAVDGNADTYWHSQYKPSNNVNLADGENNSYYIALEKATAVDKITYLPRKNGENGGVLKCEVYVTKDRLIGMPSLADVTDENTCVAANRDALSAFTAENVTWTKVDTKSFDEGSWAFDNDEKEVLFDHTEKKVTGIRIKILQTGSQYAANKDLFINGAEFAVYGLESTVEEPEPEFQNETIRMGAADSQELTGEDNGKQGWAVQAVDGKKDTYWHTQWKNVDGGSNVNVTDGKNNSYFIALEKASALNKITYLPRQVDANRNGTIKKCEIYVTTDNLAGMPSLEEVTAQTAAAKNKEALDLFTADGIRWKQVPITTFDNGSWEDNTQEKEIVFDVTETDVTGIKITVTETGGTSNTNLNKFISAAEFGIVRQVADSAADKLAEAITPSMGHVIEAGNLSDGEQIYTAASYARFEAAYAKAYRLAQMADLSNVSIEEINAAKLELQEAYQALAHVVMITETPDVTVPPVVVGQAPKDAELTGQQTGYHVESTAWLPATDVFEQYEDYTVEVTLRAYGNNEFSKDATAVVRTDAETVLPAEDVTVEVFGDCMTIRYTFKGESSPGIVFISTTPDVTVQPAVAGQVPADAVLTSETAEKQKGYRVESTTWYPTTDVFEQYKDYTVEVTLRVSKNYAFRKDATAVLRTGATAALPAADVKVTVSSEKMTIRYTFVGEESPQEELGGYLSSKEVSDIGWENGKDARKYTVASWTNYLNALYEASVANGTPGLTEKDYNEKINKLKKAIADLKLASQNCECQLFEITGFADQEISLGMSAERSIALGGDCRYTNDCMVHPSAKAAISYALVGSPEGASVAANQLTVTQAGKVEVRMTASLGGQTKTATATFTVTSKRPTQQQTDALEEAIADVETLYLPNKDKYTPVSFRAVTDAVEKAKRESGAAAADKIGEYEKAIRDAIANLVIRDKSALEEMVKDLSVLKEEDYTEDSFKKLKAASDAAKELLKASDAAMEDYTKALQELMDAKKALMTKEMAKAMEDAKKLNEARQSYREAVTAAEAVYKAGQGKYTDETWNAFVTAYAAAGTVVYSKDAAGIQAAVDALKKAQAALTAAPEAPAPALAEDATVRKGKLLYQVLDAQKKTATVVKGEDTKQKSVTIPATISINGVSCKVVRIESKAFDGYKSLTSVTIGKNVKTIMGSAFKNCGKLKKVTLKGTALKSVKKDAFAKTSAKVTVTVPNKMNQKQCNALLDKMKKAGMSKKSVIKAK